MNDKPLTCDERTDAVVGTGCRIAFLMLSFGVLLIAVVRGWAFGQTCWDLLGLIFVSGAVATVYRRVKHAPVIPWRWMLWFVLISMAVGFAMSVLMALLKR